MLVHLLSSPCLHINVREESLTCTPVHLSTNCTFPDVAIIKCEGKERLRYFAVLYSVTGVRVTDVNDYVCSHSLRKYPKRNSSSILESESV
jgi:hypothetical protein